jgi:NCAIR mutase (PurE)-related protein
MFLVDEAELRELIEGVRSGATAPDDAVEQLRRLPFADLGDALVDHHRALRQGIPEAVYAPGKTADQCVRIVGELLANGTGAVLLTRASPEQISATLDAHPAGAVRSRTVVWRPREQMHDARILVVCAGTADLAVADECVLTLCAHGYSADRLVDVGVAGIHRLLAHLDTVTAADAVVVVAGMEGALASVVGGITGAPVIAVPTSVGYGAAFEGVTALLAMLSSCASGVTVVGIDNGFGAACAVIRLMQTQARA